MKKIKFSFIILHYHVRSINDTFECVESIKTSLINYNNYNIIIVENGSNDASQVLLEKRYSESNLIKVICLEKNIGFAKGNNAGCIFAIEKYYPEHLIVLNNDTLLKQYNFLTIIDNIYMEYDFHILGPFIYDKRLKPQNPQLSLKIELKDISNAIYKLKIRKKRILKYGKLFILINSIKKYLKKCLVNNDRVESYIRRIFQFDELITEDKYTKVLTNVGLHGSALIFSKKYYSIFNYVFNPRTFLYLEENILYNRVIKNNLISVYSPELEIYHKEDRATDSVSGSTKNKLLFLIDNEIKSNEILFDIVLNGE